MSYKILLAGLIHLCCSTISPGQCEIFQDVDGRVYTTCIIERQELSPVKTTYLGSAFLTYPIWQPGTIRVDSLSKAVNCQVAYNVVDNVLLYQTNGTPAQSVPIKPYAFTINNARFVSQSSKLLGTVYQNYFLVLHEGRTQLLKRYKRRLIESRALNKGGRDVQGYYNFLDSYYIKRTNEEPVEIRLTRKSVLNALGDSNGFVRNRFKTSNLTLEEVVNALIYYDSLPHEPNGTY